VTGTAVRDDDRVLAVDLGGTAIKAAVVAGDLGLTVADPRPTPTGDWRTILDAVVDAGRQLIDEQPHDRRPRRMGLAVPGLVDVGTGVGRFSANLRWREAPVAKYVAEQLGMPVTLVHDVTAAGLAEHRLGAGRDVDDLLVVVIGTGIAATIVAGGRAVTGAGQAGELGHVVVRPSGPRCGCGRRGCLEAVSSAAAIARRYAARTGQPTAGAAEVWARLGADPHADAVWAQAVQALADALLSALALLGCARVVIGGGLARAGDALFAPLRDALATGVTVEVVPELVPAELGDRAGLIGAALAVRHPDLVPSGVHLP
jgi:glucokinase